MVLIVGNRHVGNVVIVDLYAVECIITESVEIIAKEQYSGQGWQQERHTCEGGEQAGEQEERMIIIEATLEDLEMK